MINDAEFWNGRKVLVTGHTGFKGGWLSIWLQCLGAKVTGYALSPPTKPNLFELAHVGNGIKHSVEGDIRDLDKLLETLEECQPEIVFHLAAQPLVRYSYAHPVETYETNVMGTVHVLEAARRVEGVKAVVVVTSDKCYENQEWVWGYRESDPMGGHDPYSSSKGCAELIAAAYRCSYFQDADEISVATARAGNVVGGGDWGDDRLIPDIVRAFIEGRPVHIRNPHAMRPWQHVLEPLNGYILLAKKLRVENLRFAGGWNFGPEDRDAQSVGHVVEQMIEYWGNGASAELDDGEHPHEASRLKLDISKAQSLLDWTPRMNLRQAIAWTVEWYEAFQKGEDLRAVTVDQIRRYNRLDSNHPNSRQSGLGRLKHDFHSDSS